VQYGLAWGSVMWPAGPAGQKAGVRLTPEKDVRSNIFSSAKKC
jgi:hypothetical protein